MKVVVIIPAAGLGTRMPGPHKIYYGNSGTEAVECALKLARYHTKRQHVIAFLGAFHGRTMGSLSLTASKPQQRRRFGPPPPGVTHIQYPDVYRFSNGDPDFALKCARHIEDRLFKTVLPPEEVAAIFVEPVQGEGGYVPAPIEFMRVVKMVSDSAMSSSLTESSVRRSGSMVVSQSCGAVISPSPL